MNKFLLEEVLLAAYNREITEFSKAPKHKFSFKHKLAMRKVFKLYQKDKELFFKNSVPDIAYTSKIKFNRKTVLIIVLAVLLSIAAGCAAAYFISRGFRGAVYSDRTEVFPIDMENYPETIEEKYYIAHITEGFEEVETQSSPYFEYTAYENKLTGQTIIFQQYAKSGFDSARLNTERGVLDDIEVNGHYGVYLNDSTDTKIHSCIIWDDGNYIIQMSANMTKDELIDLAKSTEKQ